MKYGPAIVKVCENCKNEYMCPNSKKYTSRFCSVVCHNKSQRLPRTQYSCINCNETFMARPDHGADRKFCSRKCFLENCIQPTDKSCLHCGSIFTAGRSATATWGDGRRLYCSKQCHNAGSRTFEDKPCVICGVMFYPISREKQEKQLTCSVKCKNIFFSGVNSSSFRGGEYINQNSNHKFVLVGKRKGYVGKYTAEHRMIISKYLGRMIKRTEIVIHINNQGTDNRLLNLYLCESMSEYGKRRHGSLPWPSESNLKTYKEKAGVAKRMSGAVADAV